MDFNFEKYRAIIFNELRPWKNRSIPEIKYQQELKGIKIQQFAYQPIYEITFIPPLTHVKKYYYRIIYNETLLLLNNFRSEFLKTITENEKKFLLFKFLNQNLPQLLKDINKVIIEQDLHFDLIDASKISYLTDQNKHIDSYVVHFLKNCSIYLFIELQSEYKQLLKEDFIEISDIHQIYFFEHITNNQFIKKAKQIEGIEANKEIEGMGNILITKPLFKIYKEDIRNTDGSLTYDEIIRNPIKFSNFEQLLFDQGYINEKYEFIDSHGKQKEMAFIFNILIKKNYFYEKLLPSKNEIKRIEIRNFLNARYCSKIEKQFNVFNNKPEFVEEFQNSHAWLDSLPSC